jgi:glycosyltransferase involved in cell wall biosynthesis
MTANRSRENLKVTYLLMAYNNEKFIREAVLSAFSQASCSLELIISDDGSTDRTYDIIRELADGYHGPHRVILNRNERNLGIGNHINRLMKIAGGELVIIASGDDVSLPERSAAIISEYLKGNARYIYSDVFIIDALSKVKGERTAGPMPPDMRWKITACLREVFGPSAAWSRDLFDVYGPLLENSLCEDKVIQFRAALSGDIAHINRKLVQYRRHEDNDSGPRRPKNFSEYRAKTAQACRMRINIYENFLKDMRTALEKNLISRDDTGLIREMKAQWQTVLAACQGGRRARMKMLSYVFQREKGERWEMVYLFLTLLFPRAHYLYRRLTDAGFHS